MLCDEAARQIVCESLAQRSESGSLIPPIRNCGRLNCVSIKHSRLSDSGRIRLSRPLVEWPIAGHYGAELAWCAPQVVDPCVDIIWMDQPYERTLIIRLCRLRWIKPLERIK